MAMLQTASHQRIESKWRLIGDYYGDDKFQMLTITDDVKATVILMMKLLTFNLKI